MWWGCSGGHSACVSWISSWAVPWSSLYSWCVRCPEGLWWGQVAAIQPKGSGVLPPCVQPDPGVLCLRQGPLSSSSGQAVPHTQH